VALARWFIVQQRDDAASGSSHSVLAGFAYFGGGNRGGEVEEQRLSHTLHCDVMPASVGRRRANSGDSFRHLVVENSDRFWALSVEERCRARIGVLEGPRKQRTRRTI